MREFFIDDLLFRIHFIIVLIRWTGFAPWEFEFPFPGSHASPFLGRVKYDPLATYGIFIRRSLGPVISATPNP